MIAHDWLVDDVTYSAEEVSDEDDQLTRCDTRRIVKLLEWPALALCVQDEQVLNLAQVLLGWQVVVNVGCALELLLLLL